MAPELRSSELSIAVLLSGRGSNFQAILRAIDGGTLHAKVVQVVSNLADAPGLEVAKAAGIATSVVDHKKYKGREAFEDALLQVLQSTPCEWIVLAGFMRVLTSRFLAAYPDRIVNIHPSLLPSFPGLHAQKQAYDYGVEIAGCTVHLVEEGMDTGPVLAQATTPITPQETALTLGARLAELGAHLLTATLPKWLAGQITPTPQSTLPGEPSHCRLIRKEAGQIDWQQPAVVIERMTRAYAPWPSAYTTWHGETFKIWQAARCLKRSGASGDFYRS